jgi:hypothetical protein
MSLFFHRQALLVFFSLALQAKKTSFGCAASSDEDCIPISELGTPSWNDFQGSVKLEITDKEDDCDFELSLEFTHDSNQPVAASPSDCSPPGKVGSDGKSLLPIGGTMKLFRTISRLPLGLIIFQLTGTPVDIHQQKSLTCLIMKLTYIL